MLRRLLALTLVLSGILCTRVQAADPVRVGLLGIDNFGSVAYTEFLNRPHAEGVFAGVRVVAAYPVVSPDYPESAKLQERWKEQLLNMYQKPADPKDAVPPIEFVNSLEDLLKKCDAIMIYSHDGKMHRQQAEAVLKAGKRLFISRPLASTTEDAVAILKLAQQLKVPLLEQFAASVQAGFRDMRNHPEVGNVLGVDVYGAWSDMVPEADKVLRSLHSIETMYAIMGGPGCVSVSCTSTPTAECFACTWKDGRVANYRGIKQGAIKYSATVFGDKGVSTSGIYGHGVPVKGVVPTDDKYVGYEGLAIEFAKFLKGGPPPVSPAETLEIFALIQAADESRAQNGAVVKLKDLSKQLSE